MLEENTLCGKYRLEKKLAEGGFGEVWLVRHAELPKRYAAKFILDPTCAAYLRREGDLLCSLEHPNVVLVVDADFQAERPFIVMEFVGGGSLRDRINRGPISLAEALSIARTILEVLLIAHAKGIVHRDLKPENILFDDRGQVKICDFGLGKVLASATTSLVLSGAQTTLSGVIVGTPAYMSPEQLAGQPADPRNDLFAWGVILYEMLLGKRPSEFGHVPKWPTTANVPGASAELDRLLRDSLCEAGARFQTAAEAHNALEALAPRPARQADPPSATRASSHQHSHPIELECQKRGVIIVESPAKAKTINRFLGSEFSVKACFGHVRDLPPRKFGIDVDNGFQGDYRIIRGRQKVLSELRDAVRSAEKVYLAPDPDREGEAIAWHLQQALELPDEKAFRITFNEITEKAVNAALNHPGKIVMDLVNAQQARRFLDRIVGYRLVPLLSKKLGRGLSAGRVQSVAVMLIVDREEEISKFKAEEYWPVTARFSVHREVQPIPSPPSHTDAGMHLPRPERPLVEPGSFAAELRKVDGREWEWAKGEDAYAFVAQILKGPFRIRGISKKERSEPPPPPFITSLLQQQASIRLRFSTKKTMMIAQQLYEGVELGAEGPVGLITYMRTDSFRIADEATADLRKMIVERYGERYLNEEVRKFAAKKGAQEAHEAIRPTDPSRSPKKLKSYLTEDQFKLYRLIWKRFVSTQMKPALYHLTEAEIIAGRATFVAKGRELAFDGFTKVAGHAVKKDDQLLPELSKEQEVTLRKMTPSQQFTPPPPRYTEAALVKALEKHGIGRPSTYAPIIVTIQEQGYVQSVQRKLFPTELGILVTNELKKHFEPIMNTTFTSQIEEKLDLIEDAKADWVGTLREYYWEVEKEIAEAQLTMKSAKSIAPEQRGSEMRPHA